MDDIDRQIAVTGYTMDSLLRVKYSEPTDCGIVLISWLAQDTLGRPDIWYAELVNGKTGLM